LIIPAGAGAAAGPADGAAGAAGPTGAAGGDPGVAVAGVPVPALPPRPVSATASATAAIATAAIISHVGIRLPPTTTARCPVPGSVESAAMPAGSMAGTLPDPMAAPVPGVGGMKIVCARSGDSVITVSAPRSADNRTSFNSAAKSPACGKRRAGSRCSAFITAAISAGGRSGQNFCSGCGSSLTIFIITAVGVSASNGRCWLSSS
jgi:hypothetical protein